MLTGRVPFQNSYQQWISRQTNMKHSLELQASFILDRILSGEEINSETMWIGINNTISVQTKTMISELLMANPKKRLTLNQLINQLYYVSDVEPIDFYPVTDNNLSINIVNNSKQSQSTLSSTVSSLSHYSTSAESHSGSVETLNPKMITMLQQQQTQRKGNLKITLKRKITNSSSKNKMKSNNEFEVIKSTLIPEYSDVCSLSASHLQRKTPDNSAAKPQIVVNSKSEVFTKRTTGKRRKYHSRTKMKNGNRLMDRNNNNVQYKNEQLMVNNNNNQSILISDQSINEKQPKRAKRTRHISTIEID